MFRRKRKLSSLEKHIVDIVRHEPGVPIQRIHLYVMGYFSIVEITSATIVLMYEGHIVPSIDWTLWPPPENE